MREMENKPTILVVDDNELVLQTMVDILHGNGYRVISARNEQECLRAIDELTIDLVLLDLKIPNSDGMDILRMIMQKNPDQLVIMISGFATVDEAVKATKIGAYDFLEKPLESERILLTIKNAMEKRLLLREKNFLIEENKKRYRMVGVSNAMKNIFTLIDRIASLNSRVLIQGESGTGKELVARAIHFNSQRSSIRFHSVNCAALPEDLIESELFGHIKGSFSGAFADSRGAFMAANDGTLFLDEIGDLSLRAQAKVLRAVEQGEISPVGSEEIRKVDVRIIAASNHDLKKMIQIEAFREDLYHRINVVNIYIPPLRERPDDIPPLAEHFLLEACVENNIKKKELSEDALALLSDQEWSGNARELRNFIERLVVFSESYRITANTVESMLHLHDIQEKRLVTNNYRIAKENFEKMFIINKLFINHFNVARTAEMIGVDRTHLHRLMKKFNIKEKEEPA